MKSKVLSCFLDITPAQYPTVLKHTPPPDTDTRQHAL